MRLYRKEPVYRRLKKLLPPAGALFVLLCFWFGLRNISGTVSDEQLRMTEESIRRAAVNCYATEGSYPRNVDYLVEHYGVRIDTGKFVVEYSIMGSNTMPYIEVVPKGGRSRLETAG